MEAAEPWLAEYGRVWALHVLIAAIDDVRGIAVGDPGVAADRRPISDIDWPVLFPLAAVALIFPVRSVLLVGHVASLVSFCWQLPLVWDHMWWDFFVELSFIACFFGCRNIGKASSVFYRTGRIQLLILYFSAVFWKLTDAFMNSMTSCATVLFAELFGSYLPASVLPAGGVLATQLLSLAPAMTCFIEFAVPAGLLLAPRVGIALSMIFHASINLLPLTYAAGFSMATCSKLLFFVPGAIDHGLFGFIPSSKQSSEMSTSPGLLSVLFSATAPMLLVALSLASKPVADTAMCMFALFCYGYTRGYPITSAYPSSPHKGHVSLPRRLLLLCLTLCCFTFAFVTPILGVQAMGANTMFASLIYNGDSGRGNHMIVPVAQLASTVGEGLETMVRIDAVYAPVNCSLLRNMMPDDCFPLLPPLSQELLKAYGNPYYYGSYLNRMGVFGAVPPADPSADIELMDFSPYKAVVVPAYELRRVLALVRERGEKFGIDYTKLPSALHTLKEYRRYDPVQSGDNTAQVQVREDPTKGLAACTVAGARCDPKEFALQPAPAAWLRRILLPYPFPISDDDLDTPRCQT